MLISRTWRCAGVEVGWAGLGGGGPERWRCTELEGGVGGGGVRGGGLIAASLPAIAPHCSDVICHSKKHFGGQMFSLSQVPPPPPPLINTGQVCANIYRCSVHRETLVCVCAEAFSRERGKLHKYPLNYIMMTLMSPP